MCRVLFSVKNSQAQLNAQDDDGWTPLHAAVYWGNMDAAEMLILHGADMDAVTKAVSVCACVCVCVCLEIRGNKSEGTPA